MDVRLYRSEFIARVNLENGTSDDRREAFLSEIVDNLSEDEISGFNPCHFEGIWTNNRKIGFDGYYYDEQDGTYSVFFCSYLGTDEPDIITTTNVGAIYQRVSNTVQAMFDGTILKAVDENNPVYTAIDELITNRDDIQRFRFYVITDAIRGERGIRDIDEDEIDGKPTQLSLFDMQAYYDIMATKNQGTTDVIFEDYGCDGIQCIKANEAVNSGYDAYLCIMPAKLLSSIYLKYGGRLIESNVRSFLGSKKKVNRGIKKTLTTEPARFFAYNNGISAIASAVSVVSEKNGPIMTEIKALQIVNGGQTTALIFNAEHPKKSADQADLSEVYVPMKLCVIEEEAEEELVRNISEYSNCQNTISSADFYSNYPVHKKLERISRRLRAPPKHGTVNSTHWYYERARGSYLQEQAFLPGVAERKKFLADDPKEQCITKTDIAKLWMSYSTWMYGHDVLMAMKPYKVSVGNAAAVKAFAEAIDRIWSEEGPGGVPGARINDNFYKNTVAIALIYRGLEKAISDKTKAPWYTSGYRANLVTYSIAKLSYDLDKHQCTLDLDRIWNEQEVPEVLMTQLLITAEHIYDYLNNSDRPTKDTREWCKKEACWGEIQRMNVGFVSDLNYVVKSTKIIRGDMRRSSRDERIRSRDSDWCKVMNRPQGYWQKVLEWGNENQDLGKDDRYFLEKASGMMGEDVHPNENDSQQIIKILARLKEDGFKE
ncbi:MAG: AIPR family protein [Candidatus Methanomethylophilus sp.]|nr:AIPR family protein [Methanomethylophilus sp.]